MTVLASQIIDRVRSQLIDDRAVKRWSDAELLRWLSDGQRTIVAMSPSLGEVTGPLPLVAGTKQHLPENAVMLLDIIRNMGADGVTPGRTVRVTTRDALDAHDPDWHKGAQSSVIRSFVYDPKVPRTYYVYPPSTGTTYLEVSRSEAPPELDSVDDEIFINDLYRTALFDYTMFRAHQKDSDYAAGNEKAAMYLQLFINFMNSYETGKLTESPNKNLSGTDLNDKGAAK